MTATAPDDVDSRELFRAYRRTGRRDLRNELIVRYRWIALHCAGRFAHRGEPTADLVQVAQLGVLKAVERFDPDMGATFATFAVPTVLGELRRHFRDATWLVRVPRRPKERYLVLNATVEGLSQRLGRTPTVEDLAEELRITPVEVLDAMEVGEAYRALSLHHSPDEEDRDELANHRTARVVDGGLGAADTRLETLDALQSLPHRAREVVYLRYFQGLTQQEIGDRLGVSQVHVSRLLRAALDDMRDHLDDLHEATASDDPHRPGAPR